MIPLRPITASQTLPVRQAVLWPNTPMDASKVEGDSAALHFGYMRDDRLVGVGSLFVEGDTARIRKLAVYEHNQGQGIGASLMRALEDSARKQSVGLLWLDARESALPFYQRLGFTAKGSRFHKSDIPYFRMIKHL